MKKKRFYGIWEVSKKDWMRCFYNDATYAFDTEEAAKKYAAYNWGYDTYEEVVRDDWAIVKPL